MRNGSASLQREELFGYLWSVPERLVRALSALAGGVALELGEVLLPLRVRRSRLYDSLVGSTCRFLAEQLGQVELAGPEGVALPDDFLVRRTAGNVVEIVGLATFHASPVWVLAALSDIAGAGREMIGEIAEALKRDGLLEPEQHFKSVDQLLDGLELTCGRLAETANTPPLNIESLRQEWEQLRQEAARQPGEAMPSTERLRDQWTHLQAEAAAQGRSVIDPPSLRAVPTIPQLPRNALSLSGAVKTDSRREGAVIAL